jgi:uncharacterized protein YodC (DUF2158 family)
MSEPKHDLFPVDELIVVTPVHVFHPNGPPSWVVGDEVVLNSGGPVELVVDVDRDMVTTAYRCRGGTYESTLPAICFRRPDA